MKNLLEITAIKNELETLVKKHGFYQVCNAADIAPATLGLYLDKTNERYISPRSLKLVRMTLVK